MTTMNISVPDEMKAFVEAQMAQEGYASASEYLRALIRDAQKRQAKQELEAKLLEGLQSPVSEMTMPIRAPCGSVSMTKTLNLHPKDEKTRGPTTTEDEARITHLHTRN